MFCDIIGLDADVQEQAALRQVSQWAQTKAGHGVRIVVCLRGGWKRPAIDADL